MLIGVKSPIILIKKSLLVCKYVCYITADIDSFLFGVNIVLIIFYYRCQEIKKKTYLIRQILFQTSSIQPLSDIYNQYQ